VFPFEETRSLLRKEGDMKKPLKIDISGMAGIGPAAWDQDRKPLSIHMHHTHKEQREHPAAKAPKPHPQEKPDPQKPV